MNAELYIKMRCTIGEGPVWDEETGILYFVDNREGKVYSFDEKELKEVVSFDKKLGFVVLREQGGMVAGLKDGYYYEDLNGEAPRFIASPEPGRTDGRFNDGKADPAGRIWGGTQTTNIDTGSGEVIADSGLYCLDEKGNVKQMLSEVIQGNGMGWNKDATKFYFIDTERFCVQEFDYDIQKNELSNGRVCVEVPKEMGIPDGMAVDDEGNIWVALWGGYSVIKYDPSTGAVLDKVDVEAPNVTSCCFGGEKMDELYITTASLLTDLDKYPLAGSVFKVNPGVTGRPSFKFKG